MHGLSVDVSVVWLEMRLRELVGQRRAGEPGPTGGLGVITGRGRGSEDGEAVVKPAVLSFFQTCRPALRATVDKKNPGVVVVAERDLGQWLAAVASV